MGRQINIEAQRFVQGERDRLNKRIDEIRSTCANAPQLALDRFRARFEDVGQRLRVNVDADKQLSNERLAKRIENTAKAGCRQSVREARMNAEPAIRAGRIAQKEIQAAQKRRRETDKEVISTLEANPDTVDLVPIWKSVRDTMFERAAATGANPGDVFLAYVEQNMAQVKAEIAKFKARKGKNAKDHKKAAKKAAEEQAPASGARPSKRAPEAGRTARAVKKG